MYESRRESVILLRIINARLHAYVFESTVGFLVIKSVAFAGQASGTAHNRNPSKLAEVLADPSRLACFGRTRGQIGKINFAVPGHKQIQTSIAVVITPTCSRAPTSARDAEFLSHVGERTVSVIVIKARDSEVTNVEIGMTIVVVVSYRHSHTPSLVGHSSFVRHIFKLPFA